jgi:hypothetical protein
MKKFWKRAPAKKEEQYTGIDPRGATTAAINQLSAWIGKICGGDVTMELSITHILHERAKAKYFTLMFPSANNERQENNQG